MSDYVPKVGDIVNVTLNDAKVIEVSDKAWRTASGSLGAKVTVTALDNGQSREFFLQRGLDGQQSGRVSIELVKAAEPPKPKWPTTPGSIISYKHADSKYIRLPSGKWYSLKWKDGSLSDTEFDTDLYEVLYDAGAPR